MQLLKWLSVTDRFYKIYLDKQLAPYGINTVSYTHLDVYKRQPIRFVFIPSFLVFLHKLLDCFIAILLNYP